MKKLITICMLLVMAMGIFGCGDKNGSKKPAEIKSAVDFYAEVWDAFGEDKQFPASGGDAENVSDAPAKFALNDENKGAFATLLILTEELCDMLDDDAATLQHAMNTNTFSSAVVKLKDPANASQFANDYQSHIQSQEWVCGFPDKVTVISVGEYVVMAYGLEDNINALIGATTSVAPDAEVLVDAPAVSA